MLHQFGAAELPQSPRNSSRRFSSAVETAREIIEEKLPFINTNNTEPTEADMQTRRHPAATASTASTVTDTTKENPAAARTPPRSPAAPASRLSGGDMVSKIANQPEVEQALQQTQEFASTAQAKLNSPETRNWLAKKQQAVKGFVAALLDQTPAQRVLVAALFITNVILPLFFLHTPEGRAVFFTHFAVFALALSIFERRGKIDSQLALAQLPWLPLIAYLAQNIHGYQTATEVRELSSGAVLTVSLVMHRSAIFTHWLRSVILVNSIALLTGLSSTTKTLLDEAPVANDDSLSTSGTASSPRKSSSKKGLRSKAELHEAKEPAGKFVQGEVVKGV